MIIPTTNYNQINKGGRERGRRTASLEAMLVQHRTGRNLHESFTASAVSSQSWCVERSWLNFPLVQSLDI